MHVLCYGTQLRHLGAMSQQRQLDLLAVAGKVASGNAALLAPSLQIFRGAQRSKAIAAAELVCMRKIRACNLMTSGLWGVGVCTA